MKRIAKLRPFLRAIGIIPVIALAYGDPGLEAAGGRLTDAHLQKLDLHLRAELNATAPGPQRVIVRIKPEALPWLRSTVAAQGGHIVAEHASIDAVTAMVHPDDVADLATSDSVISLSVDARVRAKGQLLGGLLGGVVNIVTGTVDALLTVVGGVLDTGVTLLDPAESSGRPVSPMVLRETLGVNGEWSGRGIGVAIVDSGLEMSDEFRGRIAASYDFTGGETESVAPTDKYGHGTHVAGTIGGSGALSYNHQYRGLAPGVHFVILKVLDDTGAGFTSDVIRAIDFAVANRNRWGIRVINLSLGHPIYEPAGSDPLVQAVERASAAGVIVVAAAGNLGRNQTTGLTGYAGITSPGNAPSAITVGALRTEDTVGRGDDRIPDYSSAGPTWYDALVKPDVVAPGHNIVATAAKRGYLYRTYRHLAAADTDYMRLSGTSMATAVTTGVIALALEAHRGEQGSKAPRPTPNGVKAALHYTALDVRNDLGIEYDLLRSGAGGLNGKGSIELVQSMDTSARAGAYWLDRTPWPWTSIAGEWLPWRQHIIWGTAVIWGSTLEVNQTAWGSTVIWGSETSFDDAVIWGSTDPVWDDPHTWGSAVIWGNNSIGVMYDDAVIWGSTNGMTPETTAWSDLTPP